MCNLRGILMLKLNRGDQAKACFMEALALDVKCYDAFDQLISGEMMTVDEGWYLNCSPCDSSSFLDRVGVRARARIQGADTT